MSAEHASLTRRPLRLRSTARAAWAWSTRSASNKEPPELGTIEATGVVGVDLGSANVQGRVGGNPAVDVGEAVEAADRRQPASDLGFVAGLVGLGGAVDFGHGRQFGHWNLPESVRSPANLPYRSVCHVRQPAIGGRTIQPRAVTIWDTVRAVTGRENERRASWPDVPGRLHVDR